MIMKIFYQSCIAVKVHFLILFFFQRGTASETGICSFRNLFFIIFYSYLRYRNTRIKFIFNIVGWGGYRYT